MFTSLCLFIWHHPASFVCVFLYIWFLLIVWVLSVSYSASVAVSLKHKFTYLKTSMPTQLLAIVCLCRPFGNSNTRLTQWEDVRKFCQKFQKPSKPVFFWSFTQSQLTISATISISQSKNISELQIRNKNTTASTRNANENGSS